MSAIGVHQYVRAHAALNYHRIKPPLARYCIKSFRRRRNSQGRGLLSCAPACSHSEGEAATKAEALTPPQLKYSLALLGTGTSLALASQSMFAQGHQSPALAWAKYAGTLAFIGMRGKRTQQKHFSTRARRMMTLLGVIDTLCYILNCIGLAACGAAAAAVIAAAAGQVFTALLSRLVLHRRLNRGQTAAVGIVLLGILARGTSITAGSGGVVVTAAVQKHRLGLLALLASSFGYCIYGITYDLLVTTEVPAPSHSDMMARASTIGLVIITAYYALWAIPRWQQVVAPSLATAGSTMTAAVAQIVGFAAVYVTHTFTQGIVQRSEGAMAVTLVAAVRSAAVTICCAILAIFGSAIGQPLTARNAISAAIVTFGGIVWAKSTPASQ